MSLTREQAQCGQLTADAYCLSPQTGKDCAHPALSLVGYEEDVHAAMAYVFGTTIVCDTMENAKKASTTECIVACERLLLVAHSTVIE